MAELARWLRARLKQSGFTQTQAPVRTRVSQARLRSIALITFLLLTLAACATGGPEAAAEDWYAAINSMDGLKIDQLTCQAQRKRIQRELAVGSFFVSLGKAVAGDLDIKTDTSGMNFRVIESSDDSAIFEVTGRFRGSVGGVVRTEDVSERWIMVREDGEWRWCGATDTW